MIVIVSGPPGAGKTTVAARLAETSDRAAHVVSDEFYRWIVSGFVGPHLPAAHRQNETVMSIASAVVCGYADSGYDVFWDGVVGPWWMDLILGRLGDHAIETHWLVLRPDIEVGLDRVSRRDGTTNTSGAETMARQFADLGSDERFVVPSNDDIEPMVETCRQAIGSRTHLVSTRMTEPRR